MRAAIAFAASAPAALAIANVLGVGVGGHVEKLLGGLFILPALATFISLAMIVVPNVVVGWALHPSAGVEPARGLDSHEHR